MPTRHPPLFPGPRRIFHGGDYNPEQWEHVPGIWDEDVRLMGLAGANAVSIGIFSWARLEPEEGVYDFAWLDDLMGRLHRGGVSVILATPSGAKPNWMALKYEEIRRVDSERRRDPQRLRHNHCPTSPVYREKVRQINTRLAERYGKHPAVVLWHLSNEYGGECHCPLCFAAFHRWLEAKYGDIEALNNAWWSRFWSHTYRSFSEITHIDWSVHGLSLDWKRFTTAQCVDFMRAEGEPLRRIAPDLPLTTNMMGTYNGLDYWRFAPHLDVLSWDLYPQWHGDTPDIDTACHFSFVNDIYRAMGGGRPWMQMEATPTNTNWQRISRPKRPGMHRLSSLHSVAWGADAVCYFQWRKSRGSSEKFHGAVVDHVGHEHTRAFREVAALGAELKDLAGVVGTTSDAQAAVIYDWENRWAIDGAHGPRNADRDYEPTCIAHYRALWRRGITCDVIESACDLSRYRLVVAPMLYLLKPGVAERLRAFVANGGTLVATYLTGIADENDLVHLGGWPGAGLRELFGVWVEEHDILGDKDGQIVRAADNGLGLSGDYAARHYCDVIHAEGATVAATYGSDFYAGQPAVTSNRVGAGEAIYVGSRNDKRFIDDLLGSLATRLGLPRALPGDPPDGVVVRSRGDGTRTWLFVLNFTAGAVEVAVGPGWSDAADGTTLGGTLALGAWGARVISRGT